MFMVGIVYLGGMIENKALNTKMSKHFFSFYRQVAPQAYHPLFVLRTCASCIL